MHHICIKMQKYNAVILLCGYNGNIHSVVCYHYYHIFHYTLLFQH